MTVQELHDFLEEEIAKGNDNLRLKFGRPGESVECGTGQTHLPKQECTKRINPRLGKSVVYIVL